MQSVERLSLLSGAFPIVVTVLGVLGLLWLIAVRRTRHLLAVVPIATAAAAAVTAVLHYVVEKVWRPFPDPIETIIYVWIGVGLLGLFLLTPRVAAAGGVLRKAVAVFAAVLVVLM